MNISSLVVLLTTVLVAVTPAQAVDNLSIERLATCQDSWFEWQQKNDSAQLKKFADSFKADFFQPEADPFFVPKSSQTVIGLPIAQVFPDSVGMAVGFSVVVNANFDNTRRSLEKKIGKLIDKCETPTACELEIGEKKTIFVMAKDNAKSTTTSFGCYYFYEK